MMLVSTTRSLVRKAAMAASSVSVSTSAAATAAAPTIGRRAVGRIPRALPTFTNASGRVFSSVPTDGSSSSKEEPDTKSTMPPPLSASAELIEDDPPEDDSPAEGEDDEDVVAVANDATDASEPTDDTASSNELNKNLKPSEIVEALDRHIVGQPDAKKSVAIAMRNRWRRRQLPEDLRKEVTPRNVLLVGPTG